MRAYETNGEHLAQFLLEHHLSGRNSDIWGRLGRALLASNRADEWVEAVREMSSLQLARRLISAGAALLARYDLPAAEAQMKQMVVDTMVVHWSSAGDVYERLLPAVRSSRQTISAGTRREATAMAKREMRHCYLCGTEMDFAGEGHLSFTLDHVWPRAYGGDSAFENLLGACRSCNEAKDDAASWAMYPIQSFVAGFEMDDLDELPKPMRMSVHARAASELARRQRISLREAYLGLGRPGLPAVDNASTAVDVFNLQFAAR